MNPNPFQLSRLPLRARMTWTAHLFKACTRQHHGEMAPLVRRLKPPDGVVFDIGAHAGQFAKLFSRLVPQGHVYAFEPGGYALSILRRALAFNRIHNATILPFGFGDAEARLTLSMPVKPSGSCGFGTTHLGETKRDRPFIDEEVRITTVDSVVAQLGLTRLDFIKADIEGWEMRMLVGARQTLERLKPALMIEITAPALARAGDTPKGLSDYLLGLGYSPYMPDAAGTGFRPVDALAEGDVFWLQPVHLK
jgi:FkbM family methyltransferase